LRAVSEFYPAGINRKNLLCVQCINLPNLAANGWKLVWDRDSEAA